ncbi:MBL fold metallo-hydrolase [Leptolyngbya sp. PCC 6406]|uniref:MBL fold metallo-hydrolase n=1 Tax=Leptolyngbya sp. PCC 6406 TaxID=1173264 RepID=UPI0002ACAA09|nr:MBL fold metallo-hydrolase [Leptolyngbya sp. PCC 6406]
MSELSCLPYAVGHGQEGVCLTLHMGPHRILLDCGLASLESLPTAEPPAEFVVCTHAHPDHSLGLLKFHQTWPHIPIFSSAATAALLPLNWPEVALPQGADFCQRLPWRQEVALGEDLTLTLWPSGHLPGAASILLTYAHRDRRYTVFYTGDFFLSNGRLVEGLPLDELRGLKPDVLILEGSQGTARHPHRRQQENSLADQINQAIAAGYNVLLPVPILGLGQELVMLLRSHHHFTGQDVTVWVDPWVAQGCDAYLDLLPHLPTNVQNFARHQPLFWDERILPRVRRLGAEHPLTDPESPAIVIGYQEADLSLYGGWGKRPWRIFLPDPLAARLMAAGFDPSPEETPDRVLDWLQALDPHLESGHAHLETYLLTTHCDGPGTTQLIHNLRPQHVMFVHGSPNYLMDLASLEDLQSRYQLHLPSPGRQVDLPIGDRFLQPAAPETLFEGELTQTGEGILLSLPQAIQNDPRWSRLADTGLLQIRWQGDDLVLRGISQQAILRQAAPPATRSGLMVECCFRCRYWQQPRCNNPQSSLFGFPVAAEGYCPAFAPKPKGSAG